MKQITVVTSSTPHPLEHDGSIPMLADYFAVRGATRYAAMPSATRSTALPPSSSWSSSSGFTLMRGGSHSPTLSASSSEMEHVKESMFAFKLPSLLPATASAETNSSSWRRKVWLVASPLISLCGAIFLWIGSWQFAVDYAYDDTFRTDLIYAGVGLAGLFMSRTVLAQAGMKPIVFIAPPQQVSAKGSKKVVPKLASLYHKLNLALAYLFQRHARLSASSSWWHRIAFAFRALLALYCSIIFWLGAYNMFDLRLFGLATIWRDTSYLVIGIVIMLLTSNFSAEGAAIVLDSVDDRGSSSLSAPSSSSSASFMDNVPALKGFKDSLETQYVHTASMLIYYYAKALLGLLGDVIYWTGIYSLFDVNVFEGGPLRDGIYGALGFSIFIGISLEAYVESTRVAVADPNSLHLPILADTSLTSSSVPSSSMSWQSASTFAHKARYVLRTCIAMIAGALCWIAMWNYFSYYIVDRQEIREDEGERPDDDGSSHASFIDAVWSLFHSRFHHSRSPSSHHHFTLLSMAAQSVPAAASASYHSAANPFHLMQRTRILTSDLPLWSLYLLYIGFGLVLLVITNTFTMNAGAIQPVALARLCAHQDNEIEINKISKADVDENSEDQHNLSLFAHESALSAFEPPFDLHTSALERQLLPAAALPVS